MSAASIFGRSRPRRLFRRDPDPTTTDLIWEQDSIITEKSNTENEWDETEHKFKSMLDSL